MTKRVKRTTKSARHKKKVSPVPAVTRRSGPVRRYRWHYSSTSEELPESATRELEALRVALEEGNRAALAMALRLCLPNKPPQPDGLELVPAWLVQAAVDQIEAMSSATAHSQGQGRHARAHTQHRDDMADMYRAHYLLLARGEGHKGEHAYEVAAEKLRRTFAATTPKNLHKAFKRFQRRRRLEPWRYASLALEVPEFAALGRDP